MAMAQSARDLNLRAFWPGEYDRAATRVCHLASDIAQRIALGLEVEFLAPERPVLGRPGSVAHS
jgi:hypothetical protein